MGKEKRERQKGAKKRDFLFVRGRKNVFNANNDKSFFVANFYSFFVCAKRISLNNMAAIKKESQVFMEVLMNGI